MKKYIIVFVSIFIVAGIVFHTHTKRVEKRRLERIHDQEEKFIRDLQKLIVEISESSGKCLVMCDTYVSVWKAAIRSGDDFNKKLKKQKSRFEFYEDISKIEKQKNNIMESMRGLNAPEKYKDAYDKLKEIYAIYIQLNGLAQFPSGSLMTYSDDANDIGRRLMNSIDELKILI